jgi:predicted Fe-Mo cluster-binding NifX family protein
MDSKTIVPRSRKIAVAANGPDLQAHVENKLGVAPYLVIVDPKTITSEAVPNPGAGGGRGSAMQAVVLAISKEVDVVLTGSCGPTAKKHLIDNGIAVVTGVRGTVSDAVKRYAKGALRAESASGAQSSMRRTVLNGAAVRHAAKSSARQFVGLLPIFSP